MRVREGDAVSVILPVLGLIAVACTAGLRYLAHVLHRDRGMIWRPGDILPDVPQDAAIRRWKG